MAVERLIVCGSLAGGCDNPDPGVLPLRLTGPGANVHREGDDLSGGMYEHFPLAFADLLDTAAYVYAADQAVSRHQAGGDFEQNWRRTLTFRVPVREPDLWRSREVNHALTSVLSFLSEDEYHFEFSAANFTPPDPFMMDGLGTNFDGCDEVVMFSGGLDSLAGAVREVFRDGRQVLFVNHRSNPKPGPRLDDLMTLFNQRAGGKRPFWKRVRLNKAKELSVESTQRTRSFLYATLGATYARMIGLKRMRFYENGVVSLNLPIGRQVVGARATRTTHPQVLAGFTELFSRLSGERLEVENPFIELTKTDVVQSLMDAGCGDLIRYTVSCAETRRRSNRHPHCGDCSQCIDRRFAVLAGEAEACDPADGYEIDLLAGAREEGPSRTLLASYLDVTTRVGRMTASQFAGRYGEVGRVLRYMSGTPQAALAEVFRLYQRHATQVNGVVDRELAAAATAGRFRDGTLAPDCLIRLMSDAAPLAPVLPAVPEPDNVFRLSGQAYTVRFAGGEERILLPSKGAAYIHTLLSNAGRPLTGVSLASGVARRRIEYALGDSGPRVDKEALAAYRGRIRELEEEIAAAKEANDLGGQELSQRELEEVRQELKKAAGVGGKLRTAGNDREKVRKAVTNAITRAINEVAEFDPSLAEHLTVAIDRGHTLRYHAIGTDWFT